MKRFLPVILIIVILFTATIPTAFAASGGESAEGCGLVGIVIPDGDPVDAEEEPATPVIAFFDDLGGYLNSDFLCIDAETLRMYADTIRSFAAVLVASKGSALIDALSEKIDELLAIINSIDPADIAVPQEIAQLADIPGLKAEICGCLDSLQALLSSGDLLQSVIDVLIGEDDDLAATGIDVLVTGEDAKALVRFVVNLIPEEYIEAIREKAAELEPYMNVDAVKAILSVMIRTAFGEYLDEIRGAVNRLCESIDWQAVARFLEGISEVIPEFPSDLEEVILGDTDGDGKVTILDATLIQRFLASEVVQSVLRFFCADADGDGSVTILDATCIQRFLAKLPTALGIGNVIVH